MLPGPSEFLYLERNAFLICTDSFHSSVFGVIFDKPFIIFDRKDYHVSMNSRMDTLIDKLKLEHRRYLGQITKDNIQHNYSNAYRILNEEKEKAYEFLKKALDIK